MIVPALLIAGGATLAARAGVLAPGRIDLPYPLFVLIGTLLWQVFSEAVEVPHQAFEGARSYLTRVSFPREAIILSQLYETLISSAIKLLLVAAILVFTTGLDFCAFVIIGLSFVGAVFVGLGIGGILTPFTLLFSDLQNTVKLVLSYGLFLTPALYQPNDGGVLAAIVNLNPMSPLMEAARDAAADVPLSGPDGFVLVLLGGLTASVLGVVIIRAAAPVVIERMLLGGR